VAKTVSHLVSQQNFAVFGPATWNSLPPSLHTRELSLSTFERRLKTQLFQHPVIHCPAPLWLIGEFGTVYKYSDSTQLNSPLHWRPCLKSPLSSFLHSWQTVGRV